MAHTFFTIPAETLIKVVFYLDFEDYINFKKARKGLFERLNGEEINKLVAKNYFPYAKEMQLADQGLTSYSSAIQRTMCRRKNISLAEPCSAVVMARVACPDSTSYSGGYLCYVQGHTVRILDVYNSCMTEEVIDVRSLVDEEARYWPKSHPASSIQQMQNPFDFMPIIRFQDGILSLGIGGPLHMLVIDVRRIPQSRGRRRVRILSDLPSSYARYVNNARYMYHWTSGENSLTLKRIDLDDVSRILPNICLPNVKAHIFGIDYDLKTFDGWCYVLCNKHSTQSPNEGSDTSYYYCYRFPMSDCGPPSLWKLGDPSSPATGDPLPARLEVVRTPRRSRTTHRKGKGFDRSKYLELLRAENGGGLLVVEERDEVDEKGVYLSSAYHFQRVMFPDPPLHTLDTPATRIGDILQTLDDDQSVALLPAHHCPQRIKGELEQRKYFLPSSAFAEHTFYSGDIPETRVPHQYHLIVGSRDQAAVIGDRNKSDPSSAIDRTTNKQSNDSDDSFLENHLHQFPAQNAPAALKNLLSPFTKPRDTVSVQSDERSSIIVNRRINLDRESYELPKKRESQIILMNFDPWICYLRLLEMKLDPKTDKLTYEEHDAQFKSMRPHEIIDRTLIGLSIYAQRADPDLDIHGDGVDEAGGEDSSMNKRREELGDSISPGEEKNVKGKRPSSGDEEGVEPSWFWTEKALWVDLNEGFNFV